MSATLSFNEFQKIQSAASPVRTAPQPMTKPPMVPAAITQAAMPPAPCRFVQGSQIIRIFSQVLNQEVLLCGQDADIALWQLNHPQVAGFLPVYQGEELLELPGITEGGLRFIHEVKTVFGGTILKGEKN